MASSNLIKQLQERGLVAQVTDEEALAERLAQGPIALYCGFDPTADSLHLGHLVPLLCLKRFQQAGHKPVALVGGATGLIGDPSFKAAERKLNTEDTVQEWVDKIRKQVAPFLDFDCGDNSAIAANNYDWFGSMNVLTFLRDIGKHFSVNQMINKEAVKQRLNRDDQGISFTEFSYNLLQGYDFACLNKLHGVALQIGGSDQWGNITSGIDLTRRLHQNQVFGLTVPLSSKADGTKFGKTEGGAVWLDPEKYASDGGLQVVQGLYAIGSGGFFGKGLGNSAQKMIIPEVQNDMILAIICEELGVFGAIIVLVLFAILLYRLLFIAQNAPDLYGSLIVIGIFAHIALQVIFNVCVVLNLIPTTGITLPFISYGGTSILFLMIEMGIALGVSSRIRFEE